ncbi:MAG: DUF131 domain-containing protein [Candidatus Bathyarchaeia archaeon]|nr:DUF131 domain-containing protein [Candidatus Bathyarchaeota archaeon]
MPEAGVSLGMKIFLLGFILMFIGIIVTIIGLISKAPATSASYGGFILIGPIPIIIGAGPESSHILAFLFLMFIFLAITIILFRLRFHPEA